MVIYKRHWLIEINEWIVNRVYYVTMIVADVGKVYIGLTPNDTQELYAFSSNIPQSSWSIPVFLLGGTAGMVRIVLCHVTYVHLCFLCWRGNITWSTLKVLLNSNQDYTHTTHTRLTALCPGLPRWAGTRKVKTNLYFTGARDSERQWYQLGHTQVCTSLQTDNHAITLLLKFLQAGCPSCRPTNSVTALKDLLHTY